MTEHVGLTCRCGSVRGGLETDTSSELSRYVCYCDDCQAFIRYLGMTEEVLDPHGGTEVVHVRPSRLKITAGAANLRCIGLKPKGAYRWYAACCNTPIGSTPRGVGFPFVSLITAFVDKSAAPTWRGPLRGRLMLRFASGDTTALKHEEIPVFRVVLRIIRSMVVERFFGRYRETPFFDPTSGTPVCAPVLLSDEDRTDLYPQPAAGGG